MENNDQNSLIERLTLALENSRDRTEKQLASLEVKLDQLSRDVVLMQAEIRKELQTQFVPKSEYEVRHKNLEDRATVFDQHIVMSALTLQEYAVTKLEVKQLRAALDEIDEKQRGALTRSVPWLAVLVSLLGFLYQVLQHIQFK